MTATGVDVERTARPTSDQHRCDLPTWWARRRLRIKAGAIVRCRECGARYEWRQGETFKGPFGPEAHMLWRRIPNPPSPGPRTTRLLRSSR